MRTNATASLLFLLLAFSRTFAEDTPQKSPPSATITPAPGAATTPHLRVQTPPRYPEEAMKLGQQGKVLVHAKVGIDGSVEAVSTKRSSGFPQLDEAALAAVRRWKFEPARANGKAVAAEVEVPIHFVLPSKATPQPGS